MIALWIATGSAIGSSLFPIKSDLHSVRQSSRIAAPNVSLPEMSRFPLKLASNHHFLEDASGQPFLLKGDTAWSLIAQETREEVEIYLRDRRARGFNTILVNLLEHRFAQHAPANVFGDAPFNVEGRFDTPNEAYFKHADWVLQKAAEESFLVLLAPCYAGADGSSEGWSREMLSNGAVRLRDYGRFVGRRYRHLDNIIWVQNGDTNNTDLTLVAAIAEGIAEVAPNALQTSHNANGTAGASLWPNATWLTLNNVYTWGSVFEQARQQHEKLPAMPFILIESQYENGPGITISRVRAQAYHALLTGAAGSVFGNSPIWYFDGTKEFPAVRQGWQRQLSSKGSQSMTRMHALFSRLPWQDLIPDVRNDFLVGGQSEGFARAVAAVHRDGRMAIVYIPEDRTITLYLAHMKGQRVTATWWDPFDGSSFPTDPVETHGFVRFRPTARNAAGDQDWILLLSAEDDPLN